jgi:hypothetical protein
MVVLVLTGSAVGGFMVLQEVFRPDQWEIARENWQTAKERWEAQGIDHYRIVVEARGRAAKGDNHLCRYEMEVRDERTIVSSSVACEFTPHERSAPLLYKRYIVAGMFDEISSNLDTQSETICGFTRLTPPLRESCHCTQRPFPMTVQYDSALGVPKGFFTGTLYHYEPDWSHPDFWKEAWHQRQIPPRCPAFHTDSGRNRVTVLSLEPLP